MEISERKSVTPSGVPAHGYDGWIILGYAVLAMFAFAAIYLTFGGAGTIEDSFTMVSAAP